MHFVFIYPQLKNLTGAQRLILSLAGALTNLPGEDSIPHTVTVLTHYISPACRQALPPAVKIAETGLNLNRTPSHYFNSLLEYLATPLLARQIPPGKQPGRLLKEPVGAVCFFGPPSLPGLWWAKKIRRLKIPLLYFCYEPPRAAYTDINEVSRAWAGNFLGRPVQWLFRLYRPLDRYLARQSDAILVNSPFAGELIRQTYGRDSTVITHGAELALPDNRAEAARTVREKHGLEGRKLILTVNHLHPRKRVEMQLRAMPAILKACPETTLLVVGSGPERANLRQLATELGLNEQQVVLAGFVPDDELPGYYAAADLYFHSGRAESFGLSVLEACSAGLPVVAAAEGGPCDIVVEGKSGFLVEARPENFSEKAIYLLQNPGIAAQLGQKGAEIAGQDFAWSKGAADFAGIVKKILNR